MSSMIQKRIHQQMALHRTIRAIRSWGSCLQSLALRWCCRSLLFLYTLVLVSFLPLNTLTSMYPSQMEQHEPRLRITSGLAYYSHRHNVCRLLLFFFSSILGVPIYAT